jgi:hypothetical protein
MPSSFGDTEEEDDRSNGACKVRPGAGDSDETNMETTTHHNAMQRQVSKASRRSGTMAAAASSGCGCCGFLVGTVVLAEHDDCVVS